MTSTLNPFNAVSFSMRRLNQTAQQIVPSVSRLRPGETLILEARGFAGWVEWRIETFGEGGGLTLERTSGGRALLTLAQGAPVDSIVFLSATSLIRPEQIALGSVLLLEPAEDHALQHRQRKVQSQPVRPWNPFRFLGWLMPHAVRG